MTTNTVSPLRQRMIEDMNARKPFAAQSARAPWRLRGEVPPAFLKLNAWGCHSGGTDGAVRSFAHVDLGPAVRIAGKPHFVPLQLRQAGQPRTSFCEQGFRGH